MASAIGTLSLIGIASIGRYLNVDHKPRGPGGTTKGAPEGGERAPPQGEPQRGTPSRKGRGPEAPRADQPQTGEGLHTGSPTPAQGGRAPGDPDPESEEERTKKKHKVRMHIGRGAMCRAGSCQTFRTLSHCLHPPRPAGRNWREVRRQDLPVLVAQPFLNTQTKNNTFN